jgi:hypothetical protein
MVLLVLQVDDVYVALQQRGALSVCFIVRYNRNDALWLIKNIPGKDSH